MKLNHLLFSLALLGGLTSCDKKEKTAEEAPKEPTPEEIGAIQTNLIKKKYELEQKLESLIAKVDPSGSQKFKAAKQKADDAFFQIHQVKAKHPKLRKLFEKAARWESENLSSQVQKNKGRAAKARSNRDEIRNKIEALAKELPEVKKAKEAETAAQDQVAAIKREIASQLPEATELLKELAEIDSQLVDIMKQAKAKVDK